MTYPVDKRMLARMRAAARAPRDMVVVEHLVPPTSD
jgi:hypothetical protein